MRLRDPRHPYRRALELACGAVEVVTIEEALRLVSRDRGGADGGDCGDDSIVPRRGHDRAQGL